MIQRAVPIFGKRVCRSVLLPVGMRYNSQQPADNTKVAVLQEATEPIATARPQDVEGLHQHCEGLENRIVDLEELIVKLRTDVVKLKFKVDDKPSLAYCVLVSVVSGLFIDKILLMG